MLISAEVRGGPQHNWQHKKSLTKTTAKQLLTTDGRLLKNTNKNHLHHHHHLSSFLPFTTPIALTSSPDFLLKSLLEFFEFHCSVLFTYYQLSRAG